MGAEPHQELSDIEVEKQYAQHNSPDVGIIVFGEMIRKCWNQGYHCADGLVDEIWEVSRGIDTNRP